MLIKPNLSGGNYFAEENKIMSPMYEAIASIECFIPKEGVNWFSVKRKQYRLETPTVNMDGPAHIGFETTDDGYLLSGRGKKLSPMFSSLFIQSGKIAFERFGYRREGAYCYEAHYSLCTVLLDDRGTPLAEDTGDHQKEVPLEIMLRWVREADNPEGFARAWQYDFTFLRHLEQIEYPNRLAKKALEDHRRIVEELERELKEYEEPVQTP